MKCISLVILLCVISLLQGQTPLDSSSYGSYLFKLSGTEIDSIYRYDISIISSSFLNNNIDFKNTTSEYNEEYKAKLPVGDYLIAEIELKTISYEIFSINNCNVHIANNGSDLLLSIQDSSLNPIPELQVFLKYRRLSFDKKSQMYRFPSPHFEGLLKVHYKGRTNHFMINQEDQRSFWKRRYQGLMQTPFKWIILPIYYAINLPIDGVKSIRKGYNVRSVYRISRSISRISQKFNPIYGPEDFPSYFLLNKPKFKPLDTLKYKAFILDHRQRLMNKKLELVVHGKMKNGKYQSKLIHIISPSTPCAYDKQFVLHDSLNLLAGQSYQLKLRDNDNTYATTNFTYEDYSLSTIDIEADIPITHTRNDTLSINCLMHDENQLPILDGYLEVKLEIKHMNSLDTNIWLSSLTTFYEKMTPDPSGKTKIEIAPKFFPKGNSQCKLSLKLVRKDLEEKQISGNIKLVANALDISLNLRGEKLTTSIDNNNNGITYNGTLWEYTKGKISKFQHISSDTFAISREAFRYEYHIGDESERLDLSREDLDIRASHMINADSCVFMVNSPWDIPFSYFLYEGNRELERGYGTQLYHRIRKPSRHNYTLIVQTLWAGKIQQFNYVEQLQENEIRLDIQYPSQIVPGESIDILIQAIDQKNKPVPNLNLTAHSFKSSFNYIAPALPSLRVKRKSRKIRNRFELAENHLLHRAKVDYKSGAWSDSIQKSEIFKFSFPKRSIYKLLLPAMDSSTQIAPFLISKGDIIPIHALFIDEYPVFFNWTDQEKSYSFRVSEGYHKLKFRTEDKLITVDSIYVDKGMKNIISLDINYYKNIEIESRTKSFNHSDFKMIQPYQFTFKPSYRDILGPSWFTNRDSSEIYILEDNSRNHLRHGTLPLTIGPVLDRDMTYYNISGLSQVFPMLPGYEHEVESELVTRTARENVFKAIPRYDFNKPFQYDFSDESISKKNLQNLADHYERDYRQQYNLLKPILNGNGTIHLIQSYFDKAYLNVIIESLQPTSETQILAGNTRQIDDLEEGYYRIIFLENQEKAWVFDSVKVRNNETTFIDTKRIKKSLPFSQAEELENLIHDLYNSIKHNKSLKSARYLVGNKLMSMRGLRPTSVKQSGRVIDAEGNIIGAAINAYDTHGKILKSTTSDFDGHFSIQDDKLAFLEIYSLGYSRSFIQANHAGDPFVVLLEMRSELLEEVVTVGYSQSSKLESRSFSVTAAGLSVDNTNQISIRGSRSEQTLYYVDGIQVSSRGQLPHSSNVIYVREIEGSEAQKVYQASKVILYTTKEASYPVDKGSSLRSNFSDEGFWIPNLYTDAEGKAYCTVVYPDDISSWDIQFVGMNQKQQIAFHRGKIRSYKNLSTSLIAPAYLVADDQVRVKSTLKHYVDKEITVRHTFLINDKIQMESELKLDQVHEDSFDLIADGDSLNVTYRLNYENYVDGEKRNIKLLPQGVEKSRGLFRVLSPGEKLEIQTDTFGQSFRLYAQMSELQIMEMELEQVRNYQHLCNEQLASKLIAYIISDRINKFHRLEPQHKKSINKIIRLLEKRYRRNSFWAWWESGPTNTWVSQHVIEALEIAKKASYKVNINYQASLNELASRFFTADETTTKLDILEMMQSIDSSTNLTKYFESLDTIFTHSPYDYLRWTSLRQAQGFNIEIDSILAHLKETSLGGIYFDSNHRNENRFNGNIRENELMETLLAYRVLRQEEFKNKIYTMRMLRVHILSSRINGHWRNTYESIEIIQALMDNFSLDNSLLENFASLEANGTIKNIKSTIDSTLLNLGSLSIENHSTNFMYLTIYENYWESDPSIHNGLGLIQQSLGHESQTELILKHEEKSNLQISFTLDHQSDYVMLEIPIPAGLKATQTDHEYGESFRAYEQDRVLIFFEQLQIGKHDIDIPVQAQYSGKFTWNPSKLSLMYFPILHSNTEKKILVIE